MTRPDPRRRRGGTYVVHSSAARRRITRLQRLLRLGGAVAVLLVLALVWSRLGDDGFGKRGTGEPALPAAGSGAGARAGGSGRLDSGDGYVAVDASVSPFSDEPAIARLDPGLRDALLRAASDAGADGITLRVNGGWRSARYQRQLLLGAVETYGSVEAARRFVKPPAESSHVTGDAGGG